MPGDLLDRTASQAITGELGTGEAVPSAGCLAGAAPARRRRAGESGDLRGLGRRHADFRRYAKRRSASRGLAAQDVERARRWSGSAELMAAVSAVSPDCDADDQRGSNTGCRCEPLATPICTGDYAAV
jgi:hypothetical protein